MQWESTHLPAQDVFEDVSAKLYRHDFGMQQGQAHHPAHIAVGIEAFRGVGSRTRGIEPWSSWLVEEARGGVSQTSEGDTIHSTD